MNRTLRGLAPGIAALALASPGESGQGVALEDLVREYHLDNGLTLLVVENHESPTIGLVTSFAVGAAEERPGINGVTHILEHMLFKGTPEIGTRDWEAEKVHYDRIEELTQEMKREKGKGRAADEERIAELLEQRQGEIDAAKALAIDNELDGILTNAGAVNLNAFTSYDITAYVMQLPSNRLELWTYLESERLRHPVLRQFYTEVQAVLEERRMGADADPDGKLSENFLAVAFDAHWYGYPIIGYPSDIESVTRTETEEWFRVNYAPNRMTLAIVGDVDADDAYRLVNEYFGDIPAQDPPEPLETFDIEKSGQRRIEVEYDAEPRFLMGWHKPNVPHPDDAALRVVSEILTGGRSSRLQKSLVEERQIAASLDTDHEYPGQRWDNLFVIEASPRSPHTCTEVEEAVWTELERLKTEPVPERELQKAKNRIRASELRQLESNFWLAVRLAYFQAANNDWRVLNEAQELIEKVTAEDIQRVASATFKPRRTIVATLVEPTFEPDPEKEAVGREAVARMVEALGGAEAVGAIRSARVSSEVQLSTPMGDVTASASTVYGLPDRVRSEFSIEAFGVNQIQVWSGADAWRSQGGVIADVTGDDAKELRADVERDLFLLAYPSIAGSYVLQAIGETDGEQAVEIRGPSGRPFTAFLDGTSGLPARVTYDGTHPITGEPAEFIEEFSDYREIDGIRQPHHVRTFVAGEVFAEKTVSEVVINGEISSDEFTRPTG